MSARPANAPILQPVFQPGRNCWRVEHARQAAFIVDGEDYFRAFVEAARKAGKALGVGHERRWEPAFEELRKIVDAGTLASDADGARANAVLREAGSLDVHVISRADEGSEATSTRRRRRPSRSCP